MHICDNRTCCNPRHLKLGTQKENNNDCQRKGRRADCGGMANGRAKLNDTDIREIRASALDIPHLAIKYRVSRGAIWFIVNNKTWRNVL